MEYNSNEQETNTDVDTTEHEYLEYVMDVETKYQDLVSETNTRLQQYRTLNDFFIGNQWVSEKKNVADGGEMITHNFCAPIARKYASLLMGDVPKIVVPRESETMPKFDVEVLDTPPTAADTETHIPVEFDRSEAIEKILRECLRKSGAQRELLKGALNGSVLGDTVMYTWWNKKEKRAVIEEIFPGHARFSFTTNDAGAIEYAFIDQVVSIRQIKKRWPDAIVTAERPTVDVWDAQQFQNKPSALVKFYWDEENYSVHIAGQCIQKEKHRYGRIPLWLIPNLESGKSPYGISDIDPMLKIQVSYNKALTDEANLSKMYAEPKIIIKDPGATDLNNFKKQGSRVIPVSKNAEVQPLAFVGQIFPMQNRIQRIKQDIHDVTAMPEAAFGRAQGSIVTGVAMTAQFQPTLQVVATKIAIWDEALKDMMGFVLELYEKFGGDYEYVESKTGKKQKISYKEIINGWRRVEFQWGSKVPRDDSIFIQNEVLKMNQGVQSKTRTMTNLGIDSPQDELTQIGLEQTNPTLNPKLAIEKAMADAQTGEGKESEMIMLAEMENEKMTAGQQVPVVGRNKKEHMIHIETHTNYIKNKTDLPPEIIDIIDQHIAGHEQAMVTSGGHGGARMGAGRPEAEQGPPMNPQVAAMMAGAEAGLPIPPPPGQEEVIQ